MNPGRELQDISALILQAQMINIVKAEVKSLKGQEEAKVIGGREAKDVVNAGQYDLIVYHKNGIEASETIARRIKAKMPEAHIEALGNVLADNVIGIKNSRRSRMD